MARFTDGQLIAILRKSARRLNRRLDLTGTDEEIIISVSGTIEPENEDMEDILLLQAECLIASREYQSDVSSGAAGLLVDDGEQTLDDRTGVVARGTFYNGPYSPCSELENAIKLEKMRRMGLNGKLVW